jgi:hypothetical protein
MDNERLAPPLGTLLPKIGCGCSIMLLLAAVVCLGGILIWAIVSLRG